MDNLAAVVEELAARVSALEEENARLRHQAPAAEAERKPVSRRNALRLGGLAAGAAAGTMLLRPTAAHAVDPGMVIGTNDAGSVATSLTSTNPDLTLELVNTGNGEALKAHTTSATDVNPAIHAIDEGLGGAIFAECLNVDTSDPDNLPLAAIIGEGVGGGVIGYTDSEFGAGVAGFGSADTGPGVRAGIDHTAATTNALDAYNKGKGIAVYGHIENELSASRAVYGRTKGLGAGIEGTSDGGIGGKFTGKSAQVVLVPSSQATHPTHGIAGAPFVDKAKRLWYCKGDTAWKQLA